MPDAELILELMDDYGLDRDEAGEVAEFMEENEIDDPDLAIEMYED